MLRARWDHKQILHEIQPLGGELAWMSRWGIAVDLSGVAVSVTALRSMRYSIPRLVWLCLSTTNTGDAVLRELKNARRLEVLDLDGTLISADGLRSFLKLRHLVEIRISESAISTDEEAALRSAGLRATLIRREVSQANRGTR